MAEFEGSYEETFTVSVPIETAKKHYGDLDAIIAAYPNLDRGEKLDAKTVHYRLVPKNALGAEFRGEYRCEYTFTSDTRLEWRSVGEGNIKATGSFDFKSLGDSRTQLVYRQALTLDMPVNRFLAKAIYPIVKVNIASGAKEYLEAMRKSLPKA
jgi:carbon monoxide dehydrogenase subunit G